MIGRLKGILLEKQPPLLLLDVNGVAYDVSASMTTFYKLPELGKEVILHTHLVVREDQHQLFGFAQLQERSLFRTLIKVNGVGPKLALTILSSIEPDGFVRCVMENDTASLVRLPGVGKKTAERLIIEMRDRLADWQGVDSSVSGEMDLPTGSMIDDIKHASQEAISALIALGYKPQDASRSVAKVNQEGMSSEDLIRAALQAM